MLSCCRPAVLWGHVAEGEPLCLSILLHGFKYVRRFQLAPEVLSHSKGLHYTFCGLDPGSHFLHHRLWLVTPMKMAGDENTALFWILKTTGQGVVLSFLTESSRTFHLSALRLHRKPRPHVNYKCLKRPCSYIFISP